jgi:hypothetical protein
VPDCAESASPSSRRHRANVFNGLPMTTIIWAASRLRLETMQSPGHRKFRGMQTGHGSAGRRAVTQRAGKFDEWERGNAPLRLRSRRPLLDHGLRRPADSAPPHWHSPSSTAVSSTRWQDDVEAAASLDNVPLDAPIARSAMGPGRDAVQVDRGAAAQAIRQFGRQSGRFTQPARHSVNRSLSQSIASATCAALRR